MILYNVKEGNDALFIYLLFFSMPIIGSTYAETERVRLRAWQDDDVQKLHTILQNPDINKHYSIGNNSYKLVERFVKQAKAYVAENSYGYYACEDKETGDFIGFAGLESTPSFFKLGKCERSLMWTIFLDQKYWGKGHAYELGHVLMRLSFEKYNMSELVGVVLASNTRSQKFTSSIGLVLRKELGTSRNPNTRFFVYVITREEYLDRLKNK